jgi:serine protease Do
LRHAPRPGPPTTSGRPPDVPLLLLILLVVAAGWAPSASAADDAREPLAPRRLFDQSRPGVELITAEFTAQLTIPQAEVTPANQQALQARVTERIRRGEVPPTDTAARNAIIEEITRDPSRWVTPSSRLYREQVKLSATGSGFSISSDGYIVTNAHVVARRTRT